MQKQKISFLSFKDNRPIIVLLPIKSYFTLASARNKIYQGILNCLQVLLPDQKSACNLADPKLRAHPDSYDDSQL